VLTNQLKTAIALLKQYEIDFEYYHLNQDKTSEMFDLLVYRVNAEKRRLNSSGYSGIDALLSAYSVSSSIIVSAMEYMYAHARLFSRRIERQTSTDGVHLKAWSSPSYRVPVEFWIRDLAADQYREFLGLPDIAEFEQVPNVGLAPVMRRLHSMLVSAGSWEPSTAASSEQSAADTMAQAAIDDAVRQVQRVIGKKRVGYQAGGGSYPTISIYNPTLLGGESGRIVDSITLYPVENTDNLNQFQSMRCLREPTNDCILGNGQTLPVYFRTSASVSDWFCSWSGSACTADPTKNRTIAGCDYECVTRKFQKCWFELVENGGTEMACDSAAGTIPFGVTSYKNWLVEMRTNDSDVTTGSAANQLSGTPIGAVRIPEVFDSTTSISRQFLFEGSAAQAAHRVGAVSSNDISRSPCSPANALAEECIDPNWVPAIDNELIDTSGNQYEESYRHYLALARTAADKAAALREELMNDLLTEEQEDSYQQAQFDAAVNNYLSSIREICGDRTKETAFRNALATIKSDNPDIAEKLEAAISQPYGSAHRQNQNSQDPDGKELLFGPVHCAELRNPKETTLSKLGIGEAVAPVPSYELRRNDLFSPKIDMSMLANGSTVNRMDTLKVMESPIRLPLCDDEEFTIAELLDPWASIMARQTVEGKINRIVCWAEEARTLELGKLGMIGVPNMPIEIVQIGEDSESEGRGIAWEDYQRSGSGTYDAVMSEIAVVLGELEVAESNYSSSYDEAISAAWKLRKVVEELKLRNSISNYAMEIQSAYQALSIILGKNLIGADIAARRQECLTGIETNLFCPNCSFSVDSIKSFLRDHNATLDRPLEYNLDAELLEWFIGCYRKGLVQWLEFDKGSIPEKYTKGVWADLDKKCINGVNKMERLFSEIVEGSIYQNYSKDLFAILLANTGYGGRRSDYNALANTVTKCSPTGPWQSRIWVSDDYDARCGARSSKKMAIKLNCDMGNNEAYDEDMEVDCIAYNGDDYIDDISQEGSWHQELMERMRGCTSVGLSLCWETKVFGTVECMDNDSLKKIAKEWQDAIRLKATQECNSIGDYCPEEECENPYGVAYDSALDELKNGGAIWQVIEVAKKLNSRLSEVGVEIAAFDFADEILRTGKNLLTSKSDLYRNLEKLRRLIGQLDRLEQVQVERFGFLLNDINVSRASGGSNLQEWSERYDFRRSEYRKQMRRAQLAAWVARRAIEFRFGVDLSREKSSSIYGDIPANWADEIFKMTNPKCGQPLNDQDGNVTKMTGCLAPEERIEDYVQKLEDFVSSYGNSPSKDWWFHEDDDTAVISLKNHVDRPTYTCHDYVGNLLQFSEEFDLTPSAAANRYGSDLALSGWSRFDGATVNDSTLPDFDFGVPAEVLMSHYTNEWSVFEDQAGDLTADLISLGQDASPNARIVQLVDPSTLPDQVEALDNLDFSVYLRQVPLQTSEDDSGCDADETYFPGPGRCGLPCEIDENHPAPWGTCFTGDASTLTGLRQHCVTAGYLQNSQGEWSPASMCRWGMADGSALEEARLSVKLGIPTDALPNGVSKTVQVGPYWARYSVNTVDDLRGDQVFGYSNSVGVTIGATNQTENLINASENQPMNGFTHRVWVDPMGAKSAGAFSIYIAGSKAYASFPISSRNEWTDALSCTVWLRTNEAIGDVVIDANVTLNGKDARTSKTVSVSKQWNKYGITVRYAPASEASGGNVSGHIKFSSDNGSNELPEGSQLGIWGLQCNSGLSAAAYIPTGKNLLKNSEDLRSTLWSQTGILSKITNDGPGSYYGNREYSWTLSRTGATASLRQSVNLATAGQYTFSVWMKSRSAMNQSVTLKGAGTGTSVHAVTPKWNRYMVSSVAGTNPNSVEILLAGAASSGILIYGPQLELGAEPTGYAPTDGNGRPPVNLDIPFEIAAVGAQLTPMGAFACDANRLPVKDNATCRMIAQSRRDSCCSEPSTWDGSGGSSNYNFYKQCLSCVEDGCSAAQKRCSPDELCKGYDGNIATAQQCGLGSTAYVRNTYLLTHADPLCTVQNTSGRPNPMPEDLAYSVADEVRDAIFKGQFQYVDGIDNQPGYHVYRFTMDLDSIESGSFGQFGVISPNNFNYRIRTMALNVVGTDVVDCSEAASPSTCVTNSWLPYDLKQMGDVYIRNHHLEKNVEPFKVPTGMIRGGRALAAEQVIEQPVSGAHKGALADFQRVSLMGRPLQGTFEVRIYDTPELAWNNVEDIQLVLGYHFWTRSE
jgi:hypothetical protein